MANAKMDITKEQIISIMKEEASLLDWGGRELDFDAKMPPFASLYYFFDKPMGLASSYENLVRFLPDNVIHNINNNPALSALLSNTFGGKFLRALNFICSFGKKPKTTDGILKLLIREIILHENRHCQQYDFLKSKGLDPKAIVEKENSSYRYDDRPMENDAANYSKGKIAPLEKALAMYI